MKVMKTIKVKTINLNLDWMKGYDVMTPDKTQAIAIAKLQAKQTMKGPLAVSSTQKLGDKGWYIAIKQKI